MISTYKTAKHFQVTITDASLAVTRKQDQIDEEAALDGFYVLRTPIPAAELTAPAVATACKNLKYAERDFRHIKSDDLDLRPVFHRLEERVKAHVLICMLACYLTWHRQPGLGPADLHRREPASAGQPRRGGPPLSSGPGQGVIPIRSGRPALPQLPRPAGAPGHPDPQQVRYTGTQVTVPMLTEPTSTQRQAFNLLGAAIPLTLK